jgi:hypothetical protein
VHNILPDLPRQLTRAKDSCKPNINVFFGGVHLGFPRHGWEIRGAPSKVPCEPKEAQLLPPRTTHPGDSGVLTAEAIYNCSPFGQSKNCQNYRIKQKAPGTTAHTYKKAPRSRKSQMLTQTSSPDIFFATSRKIQHALHCNCNVFATLKLHLDANFAAKHHSLAGIGMALH